MTIARMNVLVQVDRILGETLHITTGHVTIVTTHLMVAIAGLVVNVLHVVNIVPVTAVTVTVIHIHQQVILLTHKQALVQFAAMLLQILD